MVVEDNGILESIKDAIHELYEQGEINRDLFYYPEDVYKIIAVMKAEEVL